MFVVPIESNPEVMTKFLIKLGVPASVQVVDVFSLEPDMLPFVPQPVAALILLFPSTSESKDLRARQEAEITAKGQQISENIFFMKQIVRNACGSIALIHSIANAANVTLEDGHLKEYIEKGRSLDPVSRGELLEKSQGIIDCHKEIANEGQTAPPSETANVPYHFISFVEKDGSLYELDGGRPFPINHGPSSPESFLEDAAAACREYVTSNPDNLHFSGAYDTERQLLFQGDKKKGLTVFTAAIFIVGEMAGSGVLALPRAAVDSGWIGILLVLVFCVNAGYGGSRLGACWEILEERYEDYRKPVRNPYATIAYHAVGTWGRRVVSGCIQFTLFGAGTVYLLLAAQIIQDLLEEVFPTMGLCMWFLVLALVMTPFMWLGSPKDFRFVGIGALLTTAISCVLIFISMVDDAAAATGPPPRKVHEVQDFFLAFGTILFAFGGASTFPTIQNDMVDKKKFSTSVVIAFTTVLFLYLPVTMGGYLTYGELVEVNIILSLTDSPLVVAANVLMAAHLVLAFLIVINPVCQEIEEHVNISRDFGIKRCVVRTSIMATMMIVGETIPRFGKILSLVGGSTITLLTFVFPPLFYMILCRQRRSHWPVRQIPTFLKIYLWELIILGLVGGSAATYSAILAIFSPESITLPCYWSKTS